MQKLLVPVDGSDNSKRVVQYLISLTRTIGPIEMILLNVQPRIDGNVRLFVSKEMIENYYREEGEAAMAGARQALDQAGVKYTAHVEIGQIAETVATYSKKNQCSGS